MYVMEVGNSGWRTTYIYPWLDDQAGLEDRGYAPHIRVDIDTDYDTMKLAPVRISENIAPISGQLAREYALSQPQLWEAKQKAVEIATEYEKLVGQHPSILRESVKPD